MSPKAGFTFIELILSLVIITIALTGTLLSFKTAVRFSADPVIQIQATALAKSYLEEILNKTFPTVVPCPAPPAGGRAVYATVCDYAGLVDIGARDQTDQILPGLDRYTVQVDVDTNTATLGTLTSGTEVVRIDVRVTHNAIDEVRLSAYRCAY